jgi:hypothetical protein
MFSSLKAAIMGCHVGDYSRGLRSLEWAFSIERTSALASVAIAALPR